MNFLASLAQTAAGVGNQTGQGNDLSNNPFNSFNTNLGRLLNMLADQYPEDLDLKHYCLKLESVVSMNYKLPASLFVKIIESHKDFIQPIMTKDDRYFLKDLQYDQLVENPKYLALIQKVIHLWTNSSQVDLKKTISKYMILLLCHAVKATQNQVLLDVINQYRQKPLTL